MQVIWTAGATRMAYWMMGITATAILAWPLFQADVPPNLGEWPLDIAVMVFILAVFRLVAGMVKAKDDSMAAKDSEFVKALKEAQEKSDAAGKEFTAAIMKLQTDGHAHGDEIRKTLDRLGRAVDRIAKASNASKRRKRA